MVLVVIFENDAGGSLNPTIIETVTKKRHNIIQDGKTVFKYAVTNADLVRILKKK
jgi:3-oxoacyl-[acyl-carrier-protein] synthase-3